jgi:hypothetical protein
MRRLVRVVIGLEMNTDEGEMWMQFEEWKGWLEQMMYDAQFDTIGMELGSAKLDDYEDLPEEA